MDQTWRKSSYTTAENVNCVECRAAGGSIQVRDSWNPDRAVLCVTAVEWRAFLAEVERF